MHQKYCLAPPGHAILSTGMPSLTILTTMAMVGSLEELSSSMDQVIISLSEMQLRLAPSQPGDGSQGCNRATQDPLLTSLVSPYS